MYTIRKCIDEMRKFGTRNIYLNNGTEIILLEGFNTDPCEQIGTFKRNPDGSTRVMRRIVCHINSSEETRMLDDLKKNTSYYLYDEKRDSEYQFFSKNDFILPERLMNQFISYNGGINYTRTISDVSYVYDDTIWMLDE